MTKEKYPLEQLVLIKKRRLEEAEKALKEAKERLENEKEALKKVEEERDKTKLHREDKLSELRNKMDEGESTDKIIAMKEYLKTVDVELVKKEEAVKAQEVKVKEAEAEVEVARQNMLRKQSELEKMNMHRKDWEKEMRIEERRAEAIESDELGSAMHSKKKREEK
ncbi:MAG: hypothetical protein SP1CHLAM54_17450 [Chlamydiia bacterium]|nr:hypothetical protein [Chlamydiia bacterium]MCH9616633.1 hypothetical protein [Chlamydiia bacterium]MCH9629364.1 hypothetical protein [Chlamydiia bacterium]